jgi:DNA replication licensing factor MCM4
MEYIGFAREQSKPELSDEAGTALIEAYVDMRKAGATKKVVSATPRQLESLIRLSEAHARMRLSDVVETDDVFEAVRLMKVAMQSAATDPTTGTIDMDLIATGRSAADRSLVGHLLNSLRERFRTMGQATLQVSDIQREIQEETGLEVEAAKLREALATLAKENVIRYLRQNTISVL